MGGFTFMPNKALKPTHLRGFGLVGRYAKNPGKVSKKDCSVIAPLVNLGPMRYKDKTYIY